MSDIIINLENLGRFNKRLQKALKKQFNVDVPLHVASTLFANSLGVSDEYQLKQKLENVQPTKNAANTISKDSYSIKAQALLEYIANYFSQGKSLLSSIFICYYNGNVSIDINATSKSSNNETCFGLYFEDNPIQYLHDKLTEIVHSVEDRIFLENLCTTYFTDDFDENIYLGSRIIKILGLNTNQRPGQVDTVFLYKKESK